MPCANQILFALGREKEPRIEHGLRKIRNTKNSNSSLDSPKYTWIIFVIFLELQSNSNGT